MELHLTNDWIKCVLVATCDISCKPLIKIPFLFIEEIFHALNRHNGVCKSLHKKLQRQSIRRKYKKCTCMCIYAIQKGLREIKWCSENYKTITQQDQAFSLMREGEKALHCNIIITSYDYLKSLFFKPSLCIHREVLKIL